MSIDRIKNAFAHFQTYHLMIALGGLSMLIIITTTSLLFGSNKLPDPGPAPEADIDVTADVRHDPDFFKELIAQDCKSFGITPVAVETLVHANAFRTEFTGKRRLKIGRSLVTRSLDMKVFRKKLTTGAAGYTASVAHLMLRIANKTNMHLAYVIKTNLPDIDGCSSKGATAQNAIALAPKGKKDGVVVRSECVQSKRRHIDILKVEVLELTPLGYLYVSRLSPQQLGYEPRTSQGHQQPNIPDCPLVPWRTVKIGLRNNHFAWYDVIDYYSRHSCEKYQFFKSYRWSSNGPESLPSMSTSQ